MNVMKKEVVIFKSVLLLMLVFALCFFSSCSEDKNSGYSDLYYALSQYYDTETDEMTESESYKYTVVIPAGCGAKIFDSAVFLSENLSKNVGYEVDVKYDSDHEAGAKEIEILVGKTDREETREFLKEIRVNDYGYEFIDDALVIAAHKDEMCVQAVELFNERLVSKDIVMTSIRYTKPFICESEYSIDKVKLNGFDLSEYTIVYPEKYEMDEKEIAEKLKNKISEYCGYSLRVKSDNECTASERAISVGRTSLFDSDEKTAFSDVQKNTAYIAVGDNSHIGFVSDRSYGISLAADEFLRMMINSEDDRSCELTISKTENYSYELMNIGLALFSGGEEFSGLDDYRNASNLIRNGNNDIIFFDVLSFEGLFNMQNNIGSISKIENGMLYAIVSDRFSFLSSESIVLDGGSAFSVVLEAQENFDERQFCVVMVLPTAQSVGNLQSEFYQNILQLKEKNSSDACVVICDISNSDTITEVFDEFERKSVNGTHELYFNSDRLELVSINEKKISDKVSAYTVSLDLFCRK